ncbi:uncharacterized protein LOC121763503 [Salvia splendens]|uniref:uncharacterized protein LOC121763503 n=1 Tax=Salvia splendens TaxID=180675 RepID=UPI0011050E46|nr:uncharacterized protein LOC121763503 [Salvia splendens]
MKSNGKQIQAAINNHIFITPSSSLLSLTPRAEREPIQKFHTPYAHRGIFVECSVFALIIHCESEMVATEMNCWAKIAIPMRKVWVGVSRRFGFRKTGLIKLDKDVRTCEYEDIHILWDLLKRNEADLARSRKSRSWRFQWPQCSSLLRH